MLVRPSLLLLAPAFVLSACRRGSNASPPVPLPVESAAVSRAPEPARRAPPPSPRPEYVGTLDPAVSAADLDSLWAHQIIVPVEGIARKALRDTYNAARANRAHMALDITAPKSTPVLAADDHIIGLVYTGGGKGATFATGKPASVQEAMLEFPG